eukprot:1148422-Pelagomonas_calceolata.AAC.2
MPADRIESAPVLSSARLRQRLALLCTAQTQQLMMLRMHTPQSRAATSCGSSAILRIDPWFPV